MKVKFFLMFVGIFHSLTATSLPSSYEWLENSENVQTQNWLNEQQSLFNTYMTKVDDDDEIKESLKKLTNFAEYSIPKKIGSNYFFTSKEVSEKQHKLHLQSGLNESSQVIFNPNLLENTSLESFVLSPNGNYLAYSTSLNGSDWLTCKVMDMHSKAELSDSVEKIKFSPIVWSADSQGFFYSRFDSEILHSVHYHALGSAQSEDRLVYQDLSDESVGYTPFVSQDNRYLVIDAFNGSYGPNSVSLIDLQSDTLKPFMILPCDGANYWFICSRGTRFYFLTNKDADLRKMVYIDIADEKYVPQDFIPEGKFFIESIAPIGDCFCLLTSENVVSKLSLYSNEGKFVKEISLPSSGKVSLNRINQNASASGDELFFSFTNFFQPPTLYHYQLGNESPKVFKDSGLSIDPNDFVIKQIFYDSKDGTKVPMFIAHKKGLILDGNNETLLTAYGAYGWIYYPNYDASHLVWLERGGVLALANIRGGGEYGEKWHKEALREGKQNSFDDFMEAASWLIKNKYTTSEHLATIGMSSGGLLVAASANQRPDLFKAIVVEAGLLDLLRFHLFTVGRFWIGEHGNPDIAEDAVYLRKISPVHNIVKNEKFPSVLVTASQDDDRVVPSHSYKYLAALQDVYKGENMFLRLSKNMGHDSSKSDQWINERADILKFIYNELRSNR